MVLIEVIVNA